MPDRSWFILLLFISVTYFIGFFSTFTHSYISALSEKKLEKDVNSDNSSKAKKMMKIAEKKDKYINSLSCLNTFNSILYGICLTVLFAFTFLTYLDKSGWSWSSEGDYRNINLFLIGSIVGIFILGGFVYYLLGVSIPEKIGFKSSKNESGSYKIYPVIKASVTIARIFTIVFCGISSLFGKDEKDKFVTEDEILQLVDKGEESGGIESVEKELIENIFDFSNVRAGDVMTHRTSLAAIDLESTNKEILDLFEETQYSRFPVYKDDIDNIIGIISAKRFYANLTQANPKSLEELIFKPYLVPASIHGDVLLEEMQKRKTHMAIVVDEYGGTCGIVTMEDLLEKIVGNIYDETDDPATETEIIKLEDNLWRVAGGTSLLTLMSELDIVIEGEEDEELDFDTLGGLIFSCLTVIPEDDSKPVVDAYGLHIEVEMMGERRVEWALVSIVKKESEEDEE